MNVEQLIICTFQWQKCFLSKMENKHYLRSLISDTFVMHIYATHHELLTHEETPPLSYVTKRPHTILNLDC